MTSLPSALPGCEDRAAVALNSDVALVISRPPTGSRLTQSLLSSLSSRQIQPRVTWDADGN